MNVNFSRIYGNSSFKKHGFNRKSFFFPKKIITLDRIVGENSISFWKSYLVFFIFLLSGLRNLTCDVTARTKLLHVFEHTTFASRPPISRLVLFLKIGSKATNFVCFCSKIPHCSRKDSGRLNGYLRTLRKDFF